MEEQDHTKQLGPAGSGINVGVKPNLEEHNQRVQYSIPGILHFIQHEWARFEMERSQWEVERAELQARIAFLQGERKGQENLKNDLVRRIKMLEYALKQERAKYHKLKYGTDLNQGEIKPPVFEDINRDEFVDGETLLTPNSNVSWKQGRQLLRQYLQEIGYTDTIIDVRSARVRSLLGLVPNNTENEENHNFVQAVNGEQTGKRASEQQGKRIAKKIPLSIAEGTVMDTEASVLATFDFLASENVDMDEDEDNLSDEMEEGSPDDETDDRIENKRINLNDGKGMMRKEVITGRIEDALVDVESEVLSEFAFLGSDGSDGAGEARSQGDGTEWERQSELSSGEEWDDNPQLISKLKEQYRKERKNKKSSLQRPKKATLQAMLASLGTEEEEVVPSPTVGNSTPSNNSVEPDSTTGIHGPTSSPFAAGSRRPLMGGPPGTEDEALEAALGLGELAGLTVNNEADISYDISATKEVFRKTWNAKYSLRSHFDGVRALAFHPVEPVLITASEDHTLKLWNLQKTLPAKKTASLDVEPVYTFRGHIGPVLCLAMSATGEQCFSGGIDSTIRCWNIPNSNIDPYDTFDPDVMASILVAHSDAVWGLSIHSSKMQLLSCSADGTVRLWGPQNRTTLLNTYVVDTAGDGTPTSVDFVRCDPAQMVSAFTSSNCIIYDLETGKPVVRLESNQNPEVKSVSKQINRVVSHPTLPITITAHEDRQICFFDNNTGKMVHSMVAHLDGITCLAIDPNGLYLLSGSHDSSIRLWNLENKSCVQEITSHRKKFDESIFDVAFHPSKPFIASAGADALAKVFI